MSTWDDANPNEDIKPFEVSEQEIAFPPGQYLCALGKIRAVYPDGDRSIPDAVLNDIWVIKFNGTAGDPKSDVRITIKDGKAIFPKGTTRGSKLVERYPNPSKMPTMKWKAKAFFDKFDGCISTVTQGITAGGEPKPQSVVDWAKVKLHYGTVFKVSIGFNKSAKTGKNYRNLDYDTLEVSTQKIPADDMEKIEQLWDSMFKAEKASENTSADVVHPPVDLADLPF